MLTCPNCSSERGRTQTQISLVSELVFFILYYSCTDAGESYAVCLGFQNGMWMNECGQEGVEGFYCSKFLLRLQKLGNSVA